MSTCETIADIFRQFEDFLRQVGKMEIFDTLVYKYTLKGSISLSSEFSELFAKLLSKLLILKDHLNQLNLTNSPESDSSFLNAVSSFPSCDYVSEFPEFDESSDCLAVSSNSNSNVNDTSIYGNVGNTATTTTTNSNDDDDDDDVAEIIHSDSQHATIMTDNKKTYVVEKGKADDSFLCHLCANKYSNKQSLKAHVNSAHLGTKKFVCSFCFKCFSRKDKLLFHEAVHTKIKPNLCHICSKGFIRKTKLDEHLRRHSGVKNYKCKECSKSYASNRDLRNHLKCHAKQETVALATTSATGTHVDNETVSSNSAVQNSTNDNNAEAALAELQQRLSSFEVEDIITNEIFKLNCWTDLQFPTEVESIPNTSGTE